MALANNGTALIDESHEKIACTPQNIRNVVAASRLINRNFNAGSGRSSMRLEPEIWEALLEICAREKMGMGELVRKVDDEREIGGRTSAIRTFTFNYFKKAVTEEGHRSARHGIIVAPIVSSTESRA